MVSTPTLSKTLSMQVGRVDLDFYPPQGIMVTMHTVEPRMNGDTMTALEVHRRKFFVRSRDDAYHYWHRLLMANTQ